MPTLPATMRAVTQQRYGGPEVLQVQSVPVPQIASNEVLIRVTAAGVDRGTWHLVYGLPLVARVEAGLTKPKRTIPGFDVAGTVVAVGAKVSTFSVGDRVCGIARGSFAEFAPARETKLAKLTELTELTEGQPADGDGTFGVLAISGLTALQALRDKAQVKPGQRVLVLGASGGVGSFAVQIARSLGAEVTGVCSAAKADAVRHLGAQTVIDYRSADPIDGTVLYDAIIDIGGRRPLGSFSRALTPKGRVVLVGGEGGGRVTGGFFGRIAAGAIRSLVSKRSYIGFVASEKGTDVAELVALVQAGKLRAHIDQVVSLAGVGEALRELESGTIIGKVAVRPGA
jgi:NADPH:quinone reductase-like Zn-dependent oxidoreductase